ncbi:MAG: mechanosensitive ion channel [Lewinellaceae bacterium]|jgi:small-conductance mechanosensitive channel|nr:mechanosensitive ion channel [Lewinellaceae bacterium]
MKELLEYKLFEIGGYSLSVYSLFLLVGTYLITRLLLGLFNRFMTGFSTKRNIEMGRQHSFRLLFHYLIWTISIAVMLSMLGLNLAWVLASSAALLVGLGFGLQQIFSDLISGIFLLFEGTVEKDDIIEVDGVVGRIEEIYLRTTKFRNRDDQVMIIPNHKFINDNVINWSHDHYTARFGVIVGVSYDSDMHKVADILIKCAYADPDVITDVDEWKPSVRMENFGDSSVDFTLLFYSSNMFRIETTKSNLRFAIWDAFQEHGIQIPYPQRDLHLKTGDWTLNPA